MDSMMTPEARVALVEKISMKMNDMTDEDLKALADEIGIEEAIMTEDADKMASKALADSLLAEPVVDTEILTGPRGGLKNFLVKSSRDKEMEAKS
jgi:hypothetical protein